LNNPSCELVGLEATLHQQRGNPHLGTDYLVYIMIYFCNSAADSNQSLQISYLTVYGMNSLMSEKLSFLCFVVVWVPQRSPPYRSHWILLGWAVLLATCSCWCPANSDTVLKARALTEHGGMLHFRITLNKSCPASVVFDV